VGSIPSSALLAWSVPPWTRSFCFAGGPGYLAFTMISGLRPVSVSKAPAAQAVPPAADIPPRIVSPFPGFGAAAATATAFRSVRLYLWTFYTDMRRTTETTDETGLKPEALPRGEPVFQPATG